MKEYYKTFIYINILILVIFLNRFLQQRLIKNYISNIKQTPLYDIIINNLFFIKDKKIQKIICNKLFGLSDLFPIILLSIPSIYLISKKDIKKINKVILTIAILYFLRCISYSITILPSPSKCKLTLTGGCGDLLFSGHFIILTISLYLIYKNMSLLYKIIGTIIFILAIYTTLYCRNHYSIDIFISIIISFLLANLIIK